MIKKILLLCGAVSCLLSLSKTSFAQTCGFDAGFQKQLRSNPAFKNSVDAFEKAWQEKQESIMNTASRIVVNGTDTLYEVPLVFHIVHSGEPVGNTFNPSDSFIISLVDYFNQTFAATWPNYAPVSGGGVNVPIRFVLAKRDPLCNPTNGITRTNILNILPGSEVGAWYNYGIAWNGSDGIPDSTLKTIEHWDPQYYYNIWMVPQIDGFTGFVGSGTYGYAKWPGQESYLDGCVVLTGITSTAGAPNLPHELGHAFNLLHTFEGGCNTGNCYGTGDFICDTDPHDFTGNACDTGINPCTNTSWFPVNVNIMNYTTCRDRFSPLQMERMKFAATFWRSGLIYSLGGTAPGAQTTYPTPVALSGCPAPVSLNPGHTYNVGPTTVRIADLLSLSGGYFADGQAVYIDHTAPTCTRAAIAPAHMEAGGTYNISIGTGFFPENVRVYIDYNNNGTFEAASETVFSSEGVSTDFLRDHTGTITIPSSGIIFNTPLRVRVISDHFDNNYITPCSSILYNGQVEDFTTIISGNNNTSVAELGEGQLNLRLYPNPATEELHIDLPVAGSYKLIITNSLGQSVYAQPLKINSGMPAVISLKRTGITTGVHALKLVNTINGASYNGKFLKK